MSIFAGYFRSYVMVALFALASTFFGFAARGDPLDHWTIISSGTTNFLRSVTFGNGMFVAAGDNGTVLTSSNGTAWLPAAPGVTNSFFGVAYGQGLFVAVGNSGAIITSTNGTAWSSQNSGTLNRLNAVGYTQLGFVAVGTAGTILISSNASDWVAESAGTSSDIVGVGAGFGATYIGTSANAPALFWSANGSSWSSLSGVPVGMQPQLFNGGFASGNGALLGVGIRGTVYRSGDGITWSNLLSSSSYCFGLTFARGQFVAVGGNNTSPGRSIGTSTNGILWKARYNKSTEGRLLSVAYGNHRFVTVGDFGSILVSDPMLWLSNPSVVSNGPQVTLNGEPGTVYDIQTTTNILAPAWRDLELVTNLTDADAIILPNPANFPNAYYRVITGQ